MVKSDANFYPSSSKEEWSYSKVASSRLSVSRTSKNFQTVYEEINLMLMYCDLCPKEFKIEQYTAVD